MADLDPDQLLNTISNTSQILLRHRLHDYVELQNLNLIIHVQILIAFNFEGLALQYAISRARDGLFAIRSNRTSVRAANVAEDLQALDFNVVPVPINLFRPQKGQQPSRSRSRYAYTGRLRRCAFCI